MTPEDFVDLTDQLRTLGVAEFWFQDYHVKFRPDALPSPEISAQATRATPPPKKGVREQAVEAFGNISFPGAGS